MQIAIIGYRKLSFARKFGFTVRDLMFLRALETSNGCERIHWFERPDLPHEAVKRLTKSQIDISHKIIPHVGIDLNVVSAALKGRAWSAQSLRAHDRNIAKLPAKDLGLVLDFHPFYIPTVESIQGKVYWYDLIDNFEKHNRFSNAEREAVARKYDFVRKHAGAVTGVTEAAISSFSNSFCIPNKLLRQGPPDATRKPEFDFGFLGFITDKFNVEFVRQLCAAGHSILVAGHAYDTRTLDKLKAIPNLTYWGPFSSDDAPGIIAKFYVGLVPYILEKMHDESPIKFFQYISNGKAAAMPKIFNAIESDFGEYVHYYNPNDINSISLFLEKFKYKYEHYSAEIYQKAANHPEIFWESAIDSIIENVVKTAETKPPA